LGWRRQGRYAKSKLQKTHLVIAVEPLNAYQNKNTLSCSLPWYFRSVPVGNTFATGISYSFFIYPWDRASLDKEVVYMTNKMRKISLYLLLEMFYMIRAIIAHHQELGTVCAAVRCVSCEVLSSVGYIPGMVFRWWYSAVRSSVRICSLGEAVY
jgi:hypothetical protein